MYKDSPLGKNTSYVENYSPKLLYPIPRSLARDKLNLSNVLPFDGVDIWNGYEISWLNKSGKPEIAIGVFAFSCKSPNVVESKSFKLYLNSIIQTSFESIEEVEKTIKRDLSVVSGEDVEVELFKPSELTGEFLEDLSGTCLDELNITTDTYYVHSEFLKTDDRFVEETVFSNLLKSNCLATGQPDWGSLQISYSGRQIDHEGLLKYIISYRKHVGFAEHCVEEIYMDILKRCSPDKLSVYARYTRRGGLDINPFRSNFELVSTNSRQSRQ